ncbi:vitamin K epoxide reductase family protein [Streptacidiphilus sp. EB129]|uniref:vitamin K epoxide reductase family protein n=1 Tax=Streptacidiphilus sp. EB129 TaxID=3156262 RepID=UPI0035166544
MTAATTPVPAPAAPNAPEREDMVSASRALAWLYLLAGAVGLAASITLTLEKIRLLENPAYVPSCNINPIISCGSVMRTAQASAFGFPNSLIGIAGFAVVLSIGAAMLAGARFRPWFWLGLQAGTLFGIGFVTWLIFQTLYRIGAVCPYCMVVWAVTIPLFWYTAVHTTRRGVIPLPASWQPGVSTVARWHWVVPAAWYLVIALLILNRFWYYWQTLL